MITIYYIENKELILQKKTDLIVRLLGNTERNKVFSYRRWQDKQAYLLGKLLVAQFLVKNGYSVELLKNLHYNQFKRPYLKEVDFDFNISHAGGYVICAFSQVQLVGIDIELIQSVDLEDFKYILNEFDKEIIRQSADKYSSFFRIWSAKEAVLKANGCGLVNDLDKLQINGDIAIFNETVYYLKDLPIHPSYASCIASQSPFDVISIDKVSINSCFAGFN